MLAGRHVIAVSLLVLASCGLGALEGEGELDLGVQTTGFDQLDSFGRLSAVADIKIQADPSIETVTILVNGTALADEPSESFVHRHRVYSPGEYLVEVIGFDGSGERVTSRTESFNISEPKVDGCHQWLDLLGVDYEIGPDMEGVADPVVATLPINGISYRYVESASPRSTLYADCELIRTLAESSYVYRQHDIVEIIDIGVYNYRCIGGGTLPDCDLSQHSFATAIDIAGLTNSAGTEYSVLKDWIHDEGYTNCAVGTQNDKNGILHRVACDLFLGSHYSVILTPNYNSAHDNHFHLDLSPGNAVIRNGEKPDFDSGEHNHEAL